MAGLLRCAKCNPSTLFECCNALFQRFENSTEFLKVGSSTAIDHLVILPLGQVVDTFPGHFWVTFNGVLGELQNTGFRCLGHDKALIQE